MDRKKEDRTFDEISRAKKLLRELETNPRGVNPKDIEQLRRDLIAAQDNFATETAGAWVAIVCSDYCVDGQPLKTLLPISRFRDIESSFASHNFGRMRFTPQKKRTQVVGVLLRSDYIQDLPTFCFDNNPPPQYLRFGDRLSADFIKLCAFASRDEAEAWLAEQKGVFFGDVLEEDLRRIKAKLAEQQQS